MFGASQVGEANHKVSHGLIFTLPESGRRTVHPLHSSPGEAAATWAAKPSLSPLAGTSTVITLLPLSASEIRCPVLTRNKRHAWENPLKNNLPKLLNHYIYIYVYILSSNTYHKVIFL